MKIIGLMGKKQSGKNTFADIVIDILGKDKVSQIAIADPLKDFCINCLGLTAKACYGNDFEKNKWVGTYGDFICNEDLLKKYNKNKDDNISTREIMQIVGTDIFRNYFNKNIWIDAALRRILEKKHEVICITDVRFENEFWKIKEIGGIIVKLERNVKRSDSIQHESENYIDLIPETDMDYVIEPENNTSKSKLRKAITKILYLEELL